MRKSQESLAEIFGENVFSDEIMRVRLPHNIYKQFRASISDGVRLDANVAEVVAAAMKQWAVEKGATHFTHWFQPMTDLTAEKHDSFISPTESGGVMLEFAGKELVRGEADGSSFPTGGLRATFEARGYTNWDCTSPAFIRKDPQGIIALHIPTSFCSYNGEALDTRTPLLRSMNALDKQALRLLKYFDIPARHVYATVGVEQEYFLINRDIYRQRDDLIYTGRTLFGAPPPKGQEMEDQYYANIRQHVSEFMADLNEELWKLGVAAKTQHNEAAPAQHELAVVFQRANIAADHNQLVMMMLRKVAARHGLACQLAEKPFDGVSGSGKHNNWSLATDTGHNLLAPGDTPEEHLRFLLFFMAVIAAADEYADLIRLVCSSYSNDLRLGGHEAPPPILSVFIGDALLELLEAETQGHVHDHTQEMFKALPQIPQLPRDNTDRNRTSPFAFTGNKFELRMVGSSQPVATVNTILNTIVAEQLRRIADAMEPIKKKSDQRKALIACIRELFEKHRRIIFNGNNYDPAWIEEAEKRGLPLIPTAVDAAKALTGEASVALFEEHGVYSRAELEARRQIRYDRYIKVANIEARTMLKMAQQQLLPAALSHLRELAEQVHAMDAVGRSALVQSALMDSINGESEKLFASIQSLEKALEALPREATEECARRWQAEILPWMQEIRRAADALEALMPREAWPLPSYGRMLFHV